MALLLPLIGGIFAGWLAPRGTAIALQVLFAIIAATVVTLSAPQHGASYGIVVWVVPITIAVAVIGLCLGFLVRRRRLAS
jgi:energy-coupling factor transporter transmembrane protein EcfT